MVNTKAPTNSPVSQPQQPPKDGDTKQETLGFGFNKMVDDMDLLSIGEVEELQATDNHYVLLLIDVHTHMFSDFLMYRGSQTVGRGDMKERFHDAVKHHTDRLDPSISTTCRTVVRGYYDLEALDEKMRDYVPKFAAALSAMDPYFDLTYVLGEAAVEQKVVDLYAAATKDRNCKHILLAAWGRPSYLRILQIPNTKATIVKGATMKPGIRILPLALPIVELPHIFRDGHAGQQHTLPTSLDHFQQYASYRLLYAQEACAVGECGQAHTTIQAPASAPKSNKKSHGRLAGALPNPKTAIPGHVAVNKHGERLDMYLPLRKAALRSGFYKRFPPGTTQPCNWHHLSNNCQAADMCLYDHSAVTADELLYMRIRTVMIPCTDGSRCRRTDCFYGHVCRMQKCVEGVVEDCPMRAFHRVDPRVAQWVEGTLTYRKLE